MARSWWALPLLWLQACAPSPEPESAPLFPAGGTVARGYGITIRGVTYVPDDRVHSFGLVEACEPDDGATCGDHSWSGGEQDALARASERAGAISGFETRVAATDPEVRVHAQREAAAAPACSDGSSTCWFGSTGCSERGDVLLDAQGAPLVDSYGNKSWSLTRCRRWTLELSLANIYAWADYLGLDRLHVLRSVALHEMGHTLGLEHSRLGLMRAHLPVCYFIEPGDPRDVFDAAAAPDAFQRYECLEGVSEPTLAPAQRAKLDTYQAGGVGWSSVVPSAPPAAATAWQLR